MKAFLSYAQNQVRRKLEADSEYHERDTTATWSLPWSRCTFISGSTQAKFGFMETTEDFFQWALLLTLNEPFSSAEGSNGCHSTYSGTQSDFSGQNPQSRFTKIYDSTALGVSEPRSKYFRYVDHCTCRNNPPDPNPAKTSTRPRTLIQTVKNWSWLSIHAAVLPLPWKPKAAPHNMYPRTCLHSLGGSHRSCKAKIVSVSISAADSNSELRLFSFAST